MRKEEQYRYAREILDELIPVLDFDQLAFVANALGVDIKDFYCEPKFENDVEQMRRLS